MFHASSEQLAEPLWDGYAVRLLGARGDMQRFEYAMSILRSRVWTIGPQLMVWAGWLSLPVHLSLSPSRVSV